MFEILSRLYVQHRCHNNSKADNRVDFRENFTFYRDRILNTTERGQGLIVKNITIKISQYTYIHLYTRVRKRGNFANGNNEGKNLARFQNRKENQANLMLTLTCIIEVAYI